MSPPCPVGWKLCPVQAEVARLWKECQRLSALSQTDPLTGLYNWRHLMNELDREMERTRRTGLPTGLIMIDLDHFKNINDTFGHQFGDAVLRWVCRKCRQNIRKLDIPCRYGGDEIAIILPGANLAKSLRVAERLRTALGNVSLHLEGMEVSITASLGVDVYTGKEKLSPVAFLKRADEYLMEAKAQGRNLVWHETDETRMANTELTLEEREGILQRLKAYGKNRAPNQATATVLPNQR